MMKKNIVLRTVSLFFAVLMICLCLPFSAFARSVLPLTEDIETSDVKTDLLRMEAYAAKKGQYTVDETVDYCEIIELIEWGYDYRGNTSDYGLYLYIYNPSCKEIDTSAVAFNLIQIRVAPIKETVAGGDTKWEKYALKFLSKTSDNLFYKFKLDIPSSYMLKASKTQRVYEIADVEFKFVGENRQRSVGAKGKWIYTGYMSYHGQDKNSAKSNLYWDSSNLLTLELDVRDASWKTETSEKGLGWSHELSSVYFSVPDKVIKDYGDPNDVYKGLVEISGEYKNYVMASVSTANRDTFNMLKKYENVKCTQKDIPLGFKGNMEPLFVWNDGPLKIGWPTVLYNMEKFPAQLGTLVANRTYKVVNKYDNVYMGNMNGISSSDLENQIVEYRNQGNYNGILKDVPKTYFTVTNKDEDGNVKDMASQITSMSLPKEYSFWEHLAFIPIFDMVKGTYMYEEQKYTGISPIVAVDDSYVINNKDIACGEKYYICEDDSTEFREYVKSNALNKTTFILRFALTDYFCDDIYIAREGGGTDGKDIDYGNGNYYFQKEVFLDFDILSLTWENENGRRTVLPVTASPINIVGSVTPYNPSNDSLIKDLFDGDISLKDAGKEMIDDVININPAVVIVILVVIVAIIVLCCIYPQVGKVVFAILGFVGKIIILLFKAIGFVLERVFVPLSKPKYENKYKAQSSGSGSKETKKAEKQEPSESKEEKTVTVDTSTGEVKEDQ